MDPGSLAERDNVRAVSRYLAEFDGPYWQLVSRLYYDDMVVEAMAEADRLGGLSSSGEDNNLIYAEAVVRRDGTRQRLTHWLEVEMIDQEVGHARGRVAEVALESGRELSQRYGWDHREATLVTVLPREAGSAWMPSRWGCFIDKFPYDKICLPASVAEDEEELVATVRHEFMHVVTYNLSGALATAWVEEAFSMIAEGASASRATAEFRVGRARWLGPTELGAAIQSDSRTEGADAAISRAYDQATLIGMYLAERFGEERSVAFLRELGRVTPWKRLTEGLVGPQPVDAALRRVFGVSEGRLFDLALDWVRAP